MSIIKLQEEEITKLKEIQSKNNEIVFNLGILDLDINALEISIESLKERRKNLRNDFENLSKEQKVNAKDLTEKYGDGNIDLETGEFTAVE
jgi:seryl-tRNA synthetase|tara:strand:+ start:277 stop:549 length:273 start_codon:yes stop_codon:yes gene_type:complete